LRRQLPISLVAGCKANSVAGAISNDLTTITLLYDSFIAQAGSGIQPAEGRKNCQLNLQLLLPQGWQFSVFKADYRGYAFLQKGDKGVVKSTYYFSGDSTQASQFLLQVHRYFAPLLTAAIGIQPADPGRRLR
jgi:hypothetical protein